MATLLLLLLAFAIAFIAARIYFRIAARYGPYATPNFRSLHDKVIPRGAGVVIATASLLGIGWLLLDGTLGGRHAFLFGIGGLAVAAVGVADDRIEIRASYRLPFQVLVAVLVTIGLGGLPVVAAGEARLALGLAGQVLLVFALAWFYNAYNFVDGIDGMAASAAIFLCATMGWILHEQGRADLALVLALVGVSSTAFLLFNWPPARMFMGEAGSAFIGFVLSVAILDSMRHDPVNLWLWLIAGAFYFADTACTTLVRLFKVPGWYRPHRSHAYQNLARVWNSHRKVVLLVLAIDVIWIAPLLLFAHAHPTLAPAMTILAYVPIVTFCLNYGPLFENK